MKNLRPPFQSCLPGSPLPLFSRYLLWVHSAGLVADPFYPAIKFFTRPSGAWRPVLPFSRRPRGGSARPLRRRRSPWEADTRLPLRELQQVWVPGARCGAIVNLTHLDMSHCWEPQLPPQPA